MSIVINYLIIKYLNIAVYYIYNMKHFDDIINTLKLFWQYPVITEKTVYEQQYNNVNYYGIPWATLIDKRNEKRYNINIIVNILKYVIPNRDYITCCQHILFRNLIPIFKTLGIKTVYTPHKIKGENIIDGIKIMACPLYAVNIEDPIRNNEFLNKDFQKQERDILYSFIGGFAQGYLTNIRQRIFDMQHNTNNTVIKNTGSWHFDNDVYFGEQGIEGKLNEDDKHRFKTKYYNEILLRSNFSLSPSGSGPNSIRFWESLACGSIPVLLTDTLDLPDHDLWDDAIVKVNECNVENIPEILNAISQERIREMRENCLKIYNDFKENFLNFKLSAFSITLPTELIQGYYKCFGHFITDHLIYLFKFQHYLRIKNININTLKINCNVNDIKPFMKALYSVIFDNIIYNDCNMEYHTIDLGVILGSIENTETEKIYLAKSNYLSDIIPRELYVNIRKVTDDNKFYLKLFRECVLNHFQIKDIDPSGVLIINRIETNISFGRRFDNIDILEARLQALDIDYVIENIEKYTLKEQINKIYNSKFILTSGNSGSLGHYFWSNPKSIIIECHILGFRGINTISYAKNLNMQLYTIVNKLEYNKNINDKNLLRLLEYQYNNTDVLDSKNISDDNYRNEIKWYETCLNYPNYYERIIRENIDLKISLNKIIDIITLHR